MHRRQILTAAVATPAAMIATGSTAQSSDDISQASLDTVLAFMGAMGGGDMEAMSSLMADDMVWQNEGDTSLPWIGTWEGKDTIFGFLGTFSENVEITQWENLEAFASGDTVAVFGRMKMKLVNSGEETVPFTFALRAKARDGQVVLWNWLEDSYAVSEAYHGG